MDELAGGLASLGLGHGDVIAVQLPNTVEFVLSFLAITRIGGIMQTIHMPYRAAELEGLLAHSGARAVICLSEFKDYALAATHAQLRDQLPDLEFVFAYGAAVDGTMAFNDLYGIEAPPPEPKPSADDPKLILYTSGTTSSPKGVAVNAHPFGSNARQAVQEFGVSDTDIILSAAPFSHLYGLCALQIGLCAGVTTSLLPAFSPADFMAAVETSGATMLFTGPAHNAACRQAGLFGEADLSSVRIVVCSGAACPPELAEYVDGKLPNGEFLQLWGMTETQAGTYNRPGDPARQRYETVGRATPGNEIRIVGGDGGEGVAGFPPSPQPSPGRTKDVINRGGVKFNPADVEALIGKMDEVNMCAIVPMQDAVLGERVCVFVQPATDAEISLAAITEYLDANQVAKNKWPEHLQLVDAFPLTPTNKVMKGRLKPVAP